jgi:hypothetical protein
MCDIAVLYSASAIFANLCGANLQNEYNFNLELLTGLTMKIYITIIMTPGVKT